MRVPAALVVAGLAVGPAAAATPEPLERTPVRSLLEIRHGDVVIQEWDLSCGAAALATLLRLKHGDLISEREIARGLINRPEYLDNPTIVQLRQGFSLLDMKRFAENRGYESDSYGNLTLADLVEMAPAIVPVDLLGYRHFVVFRGIRDNRVLLADPAFGNRSMLIDRFMAAWLDHPEIGKIGFVVGDPIGPHVLSAALSTTAATPIRGLPRLPLSAEAWEEQAARFQAAAVGRPLGVAPAEGEFPLLRMLAALDPRELTEASRILLVGLDPAAAAPRPARQPLTPAVLQELIDYLRGPPPAATERADRLSLLPPPARPDPHIRLAQAPRDETGDELPDLAVLDRALERTLTQQGGSLVPYGQVELEPSFRYTRREDDAPSFLTIGGQTFLAEDEIRRDELTATAALRVGLPLNAQLELDLPYQFVRQSRVSSINFAPQQNLDDNGTSIGDLGVGVAMALLQEGRWQPDLIARLRWDTALGKEVDNGVVLGNGGNEIQGSLTAVKSQDPLAFLGSLAYQAALEQDNIDPGNQLSFTVGTVLAASPETSLRFFLEQTFVGETEVGSVAQPGSDQVAASLTLGAASALGRGLLVDLALSMGLTDDAADYSALLSVPIRFGVPLLP